MKTLLLLFLWIWVRLAWELSKRTPSTQRIEALLSDAEVELKAEIEAAVKKWAEA